MPIKLIDLAEWENGGRWATDYNKQSVIPKQLIIEASDFIYSVVPGNSISKSQYVFIPTNLAIDPSSGEHILKHIKHKIQQNGKVILSAWPGYGIETDGAKAALYYDSSTAEDRHLAADQIGNAWIMFSVDGEQLSLLLMRGLPIDLKMAETNTEYQWLEKVIDEKRKAETDNNIKKTSVEIPTFKEEKYIALSTDVGDSVLLLAEEIGNAAYVLKKKMDFNGAVGDWDMTAYTLMKQFTSKRRAPGIKNEDIPAPNLKEARDSRLLFRDWLNKHGNGYALRRDYHVADHRPTIQNIIKNGINYNDGKSFAEIKK